MSNNLYYGDNIDVLRESFASKSVDLIYLDPPFNSNADYSVLFKSPSGDFSSAQIEAFEDTWHWNASAEQAFDDVMVSGRDAAAELLRAMRAALKENDMMAYIAMMAVRLIELHRVLKDTGTIYLHCDPTASHYIKILLDAIFGKDRFLNEIIWRRAGSHNPRRSYGPVHDVILSFTKTKNYYFNITRRPYMKGHVESRYTKTADGRMKFTSGGNVLTGDGIREGASGKIWRGFDPTAKKRHWAVPGYYDDMMPANYKSLDSISKLDALYDAGFVEIIEGLVWPVMVRYLDERDGVPLTDLWTYQPYTKGSLWNATSGIDEDVAWLGPTDPERLGYPTQKPVGLLERIIEASCPENGVVLDPFCGCGTTIHAAQKLKRSWSGIDISNLAIGLIERRLKDAFPEVAYSVFGTPKDIEGAEALAKLDKYQFQWWAVSLVGATPYGGKKKGADGGVDGTIYFKIDGKKTEKSIVSVKGGAAVGVGEVKELIATVSSEKAKIGVLISLAKPSKVASIEAVKAGYVDAPFHTKVPKIQILTIEDIFAGKQPYIPFQTSGFKKAAREEDEVQPVFI